MVGTLITLRGYGRYMTDKTYNDGYLKGLDDAVQICVRLRDIYLSEKYAVDQPMSSFSERFALGEVKHELSKLHAMAITED